VITTPGRGRSCTSSGSGRPGSYSVCEEIVDLGPCIRKGNVRLYQYEPKDCNEPDEVIKNARKKTGKFDFSPLNNNCEHFARWCKTGNKVSHQANRAIRVLTSGLAGSSM